VSAPIQGYCPACGKQRLGYMMALGYSPGRLICEAPGCPEPDAVQRLLGDQEVHHLLTVKPGGTWTIRHPLIERIDERLMSCDLATWVTETLDLDSFVGLHRVKPSPDWHGWFLDAVSTARPSLGRLDG
jgi:hypothetical protein